MVLGHQAKKGVTNVELPLTLQVRLLNNIAILAQGIRRAALLVTIRQAHHTECHLLICRMWAECIILTKRTLIRLQEYICSKRVNN